MPHIHAIYRYPIKGLSPEPLARVALTPGETIPGDRLYAIENGPSGFDPAAPAYLAKTHFLMLMRNERLASLRTAFDQASHVLTIMSPTPTHEISPSPCRGEDGVRSTPGGGPSKAQTVSGDLRSAEGRAAIERYFAEYCADELRGPPKVLHGGNHSFSDVAKKVASIINLASVAAIEDMVGAPVHPLRFRGNVYVEGWPAWSELDLVGKELKINPPPQAGEGDHAKHGGGGLSARATSPPPRAGEGQGGGQSNDPIAPVRLKIVKRIVRCAATNVDPDTGLRDLNLPKAIMTACGHADCGVYAEVVEGGEIAEKDTIEIL